MIIVSTDIPFPENRLFLNRNTFLYCKFIILSLTTPDAISHTFLSLPGWPRDWSATRRIFYSLKSFQHIFQCYVSCHQGTEKGYILTIFVLLEKLTWQTWARKVMHAGSPVTDQVMPSVYRVITWFIRNVYDTAWNDWYGAIRGIVRS